MFAIVGAAIGGGLALAAGATTATVLGAAGLGLAAGSALGGSKAAGKGADAQVESTEMANDTQRQTQREANKLQWDMYQQSRADQLPWLEAGKKALGQVVDMVETGPGKFESSPYYEQGLDQITRATDRYNASRGLYASGKAGKDLQANALTLNNQNRGNWLDEWIKTKLNPTQSLAQVGQSTAGVMGANALTTGNNMGGNIINTGNQVAGNTIAGGNARASGITGGANAITQGVQGGTNALAMYYGYNGRNGGGNAMVPATVPQASIYDSAVGAGYYTPSYA